jgi:hypothetical protein
MMIWLGHRDLLRRLNHKTQPNKPGTRRDGFFKMKATGHVPSLKFVASPSRLCSSQTSVTAIADA